MNKTEWYEDFFTGLTLDFWKSVISEEQTLLEADFILKELQLFPQARVLDVPCGNGRLTQELASRGFQMNGVDLSEGFITEAKANANAQKKDLRAHYDLNDMRNLLWKEEFDGAYCFGNSFGYLDDEGNFEFLKKVYQVLKPGGRFLLDANSVAETVLPLIQDRTWIKVGDIFFLEENTYDHIKGRLNTDYTFMRDTTVEKRFSSHRLYTYRELCRLLEDAGFKIIQSYGSMNGDPYKFKAPGLFFVALKEK